MYISKKKSSNKNKIDNDKFVGTPNALIKIPEKKEKR